MLPPHATIFLEIIDGIEHHAPPSHDGDVRAADMFLRAVYNPGTAHRLPHSDVLICDSINAAKTVASGHGLAILQKAVFAATGSSASDRIDRARAYISPKDREIEIGGLAEVHQIENRPTIVTRDRDIAQSPTRTRRD
jgi:hypothetical protein